MKKNIILVMVLVFSLPCIFAQDTIADVNTTAITIANQYPDYPATPGDVYEINFVVANEKQEIKAFVDNIYNIDLSFIGTVNVKGLKYFEVQEVLKKKVITSYPGSIVNVLITIPGRFKVTLLGEVKQAYHIDAMSLTTLSEIISGRTTKYASIRDIEIRSEDGSINTYDLFQFYRYADLKSNPYLRPNDVITIKPYDRTISLNGEVKRPGTYQLLKNDTLSDAINLYGNGFTKVADKERILIKKILGEKELFNDQNLIINSTQRDISLIKLNDFDIIEIPRIVQDISTVTISGEVYRPGTYEMLEGDTLADLININSYGFTKLADKSRITIKKMLDDGSYNKQTIIIDVNKTNLNKVFLEDFDVINIPRVYEQISQVTITGEVIKPGKFQVSEEDNLADLIEIYSYGFTKLADTSRIKIKRLFEDDNDYNQQTIVLNSNEIDLSTIKLKDFDTIEIPRVVQDISTVTINGEVLKPGTYQIQPKENLQNIIEVYSYGFTKFAELSKIEIKRLVNEKDEFSHETIYIDGNTQNLSTVFLTDRDSITIHNKMKFMPKVFIQGAISTGSTESSSEINLGINVSNKVPVRINSGSKVSTVINSMGATFNLSSDLEKSYILRDEDKININLKTILEGKNLNDDIVMHDNDVLVIPFRQLLVYVAGSVNESKAVPFIENRTAEYYIGLAGGLNRSESMFGTYSIRNVYGEKVNKNAIISPEDVIWVNRDNIFSYIEEYAGYITTVISVFIIANQLDNLSAAIANTSN